MIIAKTKMRKIPSDCGKCGISLVFHFNRVDGRICPIMRRECPMEKSAKNGCMKYTKPDWCPLEEAKEAQP